MTQNKKKGIAKKALSISLVAAMLATSNVPVWASGFEAVDEQAGFALESEAPVEAVTADDTALLTSVEADFTAAELAALKGKLGEFIWYESATKMADALATAKKVTATADAVPVFSAEVGLVDAAASITDGALEVGRDFTAWTAGQKYTGDEVGKKIAARLVLKEGDAPYYVAADNNNTVLAADAADDAQVKDWSVVINGKTLTKGSTDISVPAGDKYELGRVVLTLGDNSTVTIPDASLLVNGEIALTKFGSNDFGTDASTITFNNNYLGISGVLTLKKFEIAGKELSSVISVADGTLTYDPSDTAGTGALLEQAKKLVNEGKLDYTTDYTVALATKADGTGTLAAAPAAGDTVYVKVAGAGEYASYKPIIKAVKIVAKDLNTLYLDQDKVDAIAYTDSNFDTALATALESVFKYNGADDTNYFDPDTYSSELVLSYTKGTTAGQPITVTVSPVQGNGNFTGSKTFTFTAKTTALPTGTEAALNAIVTGAKFTYDGKSHSINNLAKGNIGVFTRAEYTLTCVEEPSGSVKNAGEYTIVMNITSGAYAGQKVTATTKLEVEKASLNNFKYGKDVTITPVQWVDGLTISTDLKAKAAPVLTFNGTVLVEGVDYKLDQVTVAGITVGANVLMDISAPADNAKCNFTDTVTDAVVGKLQARQLPELAEVPAQSYDDVEAAYKANSIALLKAKKTDGTDGTYADLMLDTDINGDSVAIGTGNYSVKFGALPESGEGQVALTIIGKGTYTGTVTKTIAITKKSVNASFIINNSSVLPKEIYTNATATSKKGIVLQDLWTSGQTIDKVIVRDEDGTNVTANCDITYTNNRAAGTATIEAIGKAGYDIHAISTFEILPQQKILTDVSFSVDPAAQDFYYTGDEINPITEKKIKISVNDTDNKYTLVEGTDYTVSFKNNTDAALASAKKAPSIVITGMGNYTFVDTPTANAKDNTGAVKTFEIKATPITAANVTVNNVVYAGGLEVTPDIKVVNPYSGKELIKDKDYEITLENAVNAGTAKATIKIVEGNNNYTISTDEIVVNFNIAKKNLSACTASVVDGKVVIKDGVLTVPAAEYTATENEDGTFTVKAAEKNYTGTITVKAVAVDATTLKVTNRTTSTVSLGWDKVDGAEGYTIWFRSEHDSSVSRKIISGGDVIKWTQKGLAAGTKYFYTIKAWVKDAEGNYVFSEQSPVQRGTTKPYAAKIKSLTAANGKIKVALSYDAAGAEMYSMCYSKGGSKFNENNFKVGIRTKYTVRTFSKAVSAGIYYVAVKSYRDLGNGAKVYGAWSNTMKVVVK